MKVTAKLEHRGSIPNTRWCDPVGWRPANVIDDAELIDGSWWDDNENVAGLLWFGDTNTHGAEDVVEADLDDLRVVSCGDCRVIGEVELPG